MYAYHCAQLLYTTQHRTVLITFPLILQTSTRAVYWRGGSHYFWPVKLAKSNLLAIMTIATTIQLFLSRRMQD